MSFSLFLLLSPFFFRARYGAAAHLCSPMPPVSFTTSTTNATKIQKNHHSDDHTKQDTYRSPQAGGYTRQTSRSPAGTARHAHYTRRKPAKSTAWGCPQTSTPSHAPHAATWPGTAPPASASPPTVSGPAAPRQGWYPGGRSECRCRPG